MEKIILYSFYIAASVIVYWALIPVTWRSFFLLSVSLFFISLISFPCVLYFLANVFLVYSGGALINKEDGRKKLVLKLMLVWLIGNMVVFKDIHLILNALSRIGNPLLAFKFDFKLAALPIGLSYITFRLVHYIVESYRGAVPKSSFCDFALYVLFFPTLLAGPVERFPRFHQQTGEIKNVDIREINYGLYRIIKGALKKFFIGDSLSRAVMPILFNPQMHSRTEILPAIYGSALVLFMDFSGYTDIAIGVSRLFGYKIVENFDRPFFKKNIALAIRSWHISVYSWARDYFFFPLFGYRASKIKIYLGVFATLLVFALWHKASLPFIILSAYFGSGLAFWHIFQEIKRKYPSVRKCSSWPGMDYFSCLITACYSMFGAIFFYLDMENISRILVKVF